jgi:hypothetical protein
MPPAKLAQLELLVSGVKWRDSTTYPPDKQEKATQTVIEQAELIAKDWPEWGAV